MGLPLLFIRDNASVIHFRPGSYAHLLYTVYGVKPQSVTFKLIMSTVFPHMTAMTKHQYSAVVTAETTMPLKSCVYTLLTQCVNISEKGPRSQKSLFFLAPNLFFFSSFVKSYPT